MSGTIPPIDQVIVRKTGGYNLKSVSWWKGLTPSEQMDLIAEEGVQFFAAGLEIDADIATAQLLPDGANRGAQSAPSAAVEMAWPPNGLRPTAATYIRTVVEGPRWLVNKRTQDGEVELYTVRGRSSSAVYDLTKPLGIQLLSDDLLLDALGFDETHRHIAQEHRQAFDYFRENVFAAHLGDRKWETSDQKVRSTLASNPYLRLVEESDALSDF